MGDYKGPYALTGPLLVCTHGTQYCYAIQHKHNHACSKTVYVLHTKLVTFWGKQYWFNMWNKLTFTIINILVLVLSIVITMLEH